MIQDIVAKQREYFLSGKTRDIQVRKSNLLKIKALLLKYYDKFVNAFKLDYNKCEFDVLSTEFYLVLDECNYMIKNIRKLNKIKRVRTSLINFPSKGYLIQEPYGVTLIMSPWNYPLQLTLEPLMGAIAAGNTVILKPASYTKNVSEVINEMFLEFNNPELISVVLGGREQNQELLDQRFDYIFFTGGQKVGRLVLEKAAKWLTPVSLELGGKSPTIVDKDADLDLAAKRIVWGKFINAGQTCVAPDYIYVHESVHDEFLKLAKEYIHKFYYTNGQLNENFTHLINEKHADKIKSFISKEKIVEGGTINDLVITPTILDNVNLDDPCMKEEIFGAIMPILTFNNLNTLLNHLSHQEKPLAFYYFSKNKKKARWVMKNASFGGGCINETIMHLTNSELPFGGVGFSGMGSYHGKKSFETFSHQKSVLVKSKAEINIKYPPYNEKKLKLLKKLSGIKTN